MNLSCFNRFHESPVCHGYFMNNQYVMDISWIIMSWIFHESSVCHGYFMNYQYVMDISWIISMSWIFHESLVCHGYFMNNQYVMDISWIIIMSWIFHESSVCHGSSAHHDSYMFYDSSAIKDTDYWYRLFMIPMHSSIFKSLYFYDQPFYYSHHSLWLSNILLAKALHDLRNNFSLPVNYPWLTHVVGAGVH